MTRKALPPATPRGHRSARAAVVAAVSVLAMTVGGVPAHAGAHADARMASNLRDLATIEETFFVDHLHYAGAHGLRSQDLSYVTLTTGQVVIVHLGHWSYCLAGRVAPHRYFVYASENGGLLGPKRTDTCSPTVYPRLAGRLRPGS